MLIIFNHSLIVNQEKMEIIETGDTALVIAKAIFERQSKRFRILHGENRNIRIQKKKLMELGVV
ncbi:hypothetical protein GCM10020331_086360 [Ectobacillus funiculus]